MLTGRTISRKLLLLLLGTTAAGLLLAGAAMVAYDAYTYRENAASDLSAQADILALAVAPALQFDDPDSAREYLELMKARPNVVSAAIYTNKGALFASYWAHGHVSEEPSFPMLPEADGYHFVGDNLTLSQRIVQDGEILGTLYFNSAYAPFARLRDFVGILSIVVVLSLAITALISAHLQKTITAPILDVTAIARRVMEERNFGLRARRLSNDEIGTLVSAFNGMLGEIGKQTETLEASNQQLQREVAERQRAEKVADHTERRLRTLVSAITQVVLYTDQHGRFADERSSWQVYTGQTREQYTGFGWRSAFAEESRVTLETAWARAVLSPEPFELELRLWHADTSKYRFVVLRAVPLIEPDGSLPEWIGGIQDIDDRRGLEENLRTLNGELEQRVHRRTALLEEANKELESFSYSISHDLRAPIRAIGGFCTLLGRDHGAALDPEAQRKVGIIKGEAERMGALIDDLLAFSRLGRKGIAPTELDMQSMVDNVYARLIRDAGDRQVEFHVGTLPKAFGDKSLFEQVWVNLLSNALKFSSKKESPVIEVGAISAETEHVYFVRDNGAGFDPKHQGNLFGVFHRLHHADEFSGTGVGLALVHRIVTRHGGRIWADAKIGEGATFHFTVPKEQSGGRV